MRRVWIARAVAQLVFTAAIVFVVAAVAAGLLALVRGGEFLGQPPGHGAFDRSAAPAGGATGGAFSRAADAEARQSALGRLPGVPSWTESRPEEPTISSGAVFVVSGFALIGLGLVVG
jgi:hypothetical protein